MIKSTFAGVWMETVWAWIESWSISVDVITVPRLFCEGASASFSIRLQSAALIPVTLFPFSAVPWTRAIFSMGDGRTCWERFHQIWSRMIDYMMLRVGEKRERDESKATFCLCVLQSFVWMGHFMKPGIACDLRNKWRGEIYPSVIAVRCTCISPFV